MLYASRLLEYKKPFGAVPQGTPVQFWVRPKRIQVWRDVYLVVRDEFLEKTYEYPMQWECLQDECDVFTVTLCTKNLLGPIWYWFRYTDFHGKSGIYHTPTPLPFGEGIVNYEHEHAETKAYQLTVYKKNNTPDWYGKGITYHIFPDRFNRTKIPNPEGLVGGRVVHENWSDVPVFWPDEKGEIRNNDFFGGNIGGIREKLPYIKSLGVKTIYFSPIFEAASNHRYDTACYTKIDPMFGTEEEFSLLCSDAEKLGIKIILDGVFNHTGYDSVYFNGRKSYPNDGAYNSQNSPYYEWYNFEQWPNKYSSWWGIYTLPDIQENTQSYKDFIYDKETSVVRKWLKLGASGWRLDVADELPDEFIAGLRKAAREEKPDAVVIGEVWEDASNKIAYDIRRKYLLGDELDSVMNYPLRNSIIEFVRGGDAKTFRLGMEQLRENYPRDIFYNLMNALGTHDTPRILTILGVEENDWSLSKEHQSQYHLSSERLFVATKRLKMASALLFCFPGSPCVYYGDEVGLEGFADPLNRRTFPWGNENKEILEWYKKLGSARNTISALQDGELSYVCSDGGILCLRRFDDKTEAYLCVNRCDCVNSITLPWRETAAQDYLSGTPYVPISGQIEITLEPMSVRIITK